MAVSASVDLASAPRTQADRGPPEPAPADLLDVAVIGGGLAGSVAAAVLGQAGYRVALIERHAEPPSQFRVEKIAGPQIDSLRRLGLLDGVAAASTAFDEVLNVRRGRVVDRTRARHYAIFYDELIRAVQQQIPDTVDRIVDRATGIENSADRQRVTLASGAELESRLVVLAAGMGDVLRESLGMTRRVIAEKHSISFGFNVAPAPGETFPFTSLTYYGGSVTEAIDYLTLFPLREILRANLFTFRGQNDPWVAEIRRNPKEALLNALPGLERLLGDFQMASPVQPWVMDLCEMHDYEQPGVVLVGDAFQTSCPAAGCGVTRLLTDVERLCAVHAPMWLSTPGMGVDKIAEFYRDTGKRASDHLALKSSIYRRALTVGTGLRGLALRQREFLPRRVLGWARELRGA